MQAVATGNGFVGSLSFPRPTRGIGMGESVGLTGCRQRLGIWSSHDARRSAEFSFMFFTQTHLSEQFEVRLPLATQMHWPTEHY